jgi:hypothetical protein
MRTADKKQGVDKREQLVALNRFLWHNGNTNLAYAVWGAFGDFRGAQASDIPAIERLLVDAATEKVRVKLHRFLWHALSDRELLDAAPDLVEAALVAEVKRVIKNAAFGREKRAAAAKKAKVRND